MSVSRFVEKSIPTSSPGYDRGGAHIRLDNGIARPWSHVPEHPQDETVAHWQRLLAAGLIGNRAPCPPEVAAQREANDALFRGCARDRHLVDRLAAHL